MDAPPTYEEVAKALAPKHSGILGIFKRLFKRRSSLSTNKYCFSEKSKKSKSTAELQQEVELLKEELNKTTVTVHELERKTVEVEKKLDDQAKPPVVFGAAKPVDRTQKYVLALQGQKYYFGGQNSPIVSMPSGCDTSKWFRTRRVTFGVNGSWVASYEQENGKAYWLHGNSFKTLYPEVYTWLSTYPRTATVNVCLGPKAYYFAHRLKEKAIWNLPLDIRSAINIETEHDRVRQIVWGRGDDWVVVFNDGTYQYRLANMNTALAQVLQRVDGIGGIQALAIDLSLEDSFVLVTMSGNILSSLQSSAEFLPYLVNDWKKANSPSLCD